MSEKVKRNKLSWAALVNKANPDRRKPKPEYIFSNGRKFYDRGRVNYT